MITIVEDGSDITLTRSEHTHLLREWNEVCKYTVRPSTFEEFVRQKKRTQKRELNRALLRD
jgi:hypothetical protein